MTHANQLDLALQDIYSGQAPSRDEHGIRINTIGENAQLDSFSPEIESHKKEIHRIDIENVELRKQVSSIADDYNKKTETYNLNVEKHNQKIEAISEKLSEGKKTERFLSKLTTTYAKESQQLKAGSKKKNFSGFGILLLVTLGLEIITYFATYSLQHEVLSTVDIIIRFFIVLAISGISALLHWLHKRNGNKIVQAMLISTIALSLVTMFHVIYISLNAQENVVAIDFSFGNEQEVIYADGFFKKLINRPGLAELMLAAVFCITGVICDVIGNKADTAHIGKIQEESQELSFRDKRLIEVKVHNEMMEEEFLSEQAIKDEINNTYLSCLLEIFNLLSEIKEAIDRKTEERDAICMRLKDSYQKQLHIMCDNRSMRKRMLHDMKDIPEAEIVYEEWTLDDIKHYYNND